MLGLWWVGLCCGWQRIIRGVIFSWSDHDFERLQSSAEVFFCDDLQFCNLQRAKRGADLILNGFDLELVECSSWLWGCVA